MRRMEVEFSPPWVGEDEINEVIATLKSQWITTGPKTKKFERMFADYLNTSKALALNSCTAGLHTALLVSGIQEGDQVITTPMSFAASVNVIEHVGAEHVFVDVQEDTLNIDVDRIEEKVTPRTRAILPVHYAGHPVDLDLIRELSAAHHLLVLEDAAHAFPAKYKGRYIGSGSNPTAFSFYPTKNITTGEGGMLTGEESFIDKARMISLHGLNKDAWRRYQNDSAWYYEVVQPGFKYNMTDIQASLGIHQLKRVKSFQERRREIVKRYNQAFSREESLQTPVERDEVDHSWHLYVLRLHLDQLSIDRDQFIDDLARKYHIKTSVSFIPLHVHPYYREKYQYSPEDFPVAYNNFLRIICLPLYPKLTNAQVDYVIEAVLELARGCRR